MKRKSKSEQESIVMALRSIGESSDPLIIECSKTAKAFAKRITEAKTEAEQDKIRDEFNHWSETDATFKRIILGLKTLLGR